MDDGDEAEEAMVVALRPSLADTIGSWVWISGGGSLSLMNAKNPTVPLDLNSLPSGAPLRGVAGEFGKELGPPPMPLDGVDDAPPLEEVEPLDAARSFFFLLLERSLFSIVSDRSYAARLVSSIA